MSFLKKFATAASAAVIAIPLSADFADAGNYRRNRGPDLGKAIGIGAAAGILGAILSQQARPARAQGYYGEAQPYYNERAARRAQRNMQENTRMCVRGNMMIPCDSMPSRQRSFNNGSMGYQQPNYGIPQFNGGGGNYQRPRERNCVEVPNGPYNTRRQCF